ncbi:MAG: hypothetical protein DRI37_04985 [Chloroflexi bacterium]|nr:MAG: hypothetical protein DRI37_04985 [Chloroflexota bacterium]
MVGENMSVGATDDHWRYSVVAQSRLQSCSACQHCMVAGSQSICKFTMRVIHDPSNSTCAKFESVLSMRNMDSSERSASFLMNLWV